ncbi:MAG: hypothetical protein ACE5EE_04520 [Fidelibacterota bacterium]
MSEFVIVIIVAVVLIIVFFAGRNQQMKTISSKRSENIERHKTWADESILTPEQVEEKLEGLRKLIQEEIVPTHPHRAELLMEIVEEWATLKKQAFKDRRSWVRKPDKKDNGES